MNLIPKLSGVNLSQARRSQTKLAMTIYLGDNRIFKIVIQGSKSSVLLWQISFYGDASDDYGDLSFAVKRNL